MSYSYSDVERANLKWFENDHSRQSLKRIHLQKGAIRGLKLLSIDFSYPIAAIAGKNGCGKSSLLAIAACAYHNSPTGWKLPDRTASYYTFSDFFIQSVSDAKLEGISIGYGILHNRWRGASGAETWAGLGFQIREKKKSGKWNDYDTRVLRPAAFLGIDRVVPPSERSVFRNYRSQFSGKKAKGDWEDATRECVARILGQPYEDFEVHSHARYRLHLVSCRGMRYSGLNMGAGEKALFELVGALQACPDGALILVDEIELALHESAQRRLITELSLICNRKKLQIICTTHSPIILESLPPEARFLVSPGTGQTNITPGITPAFAAGRMGEHNSDEASVYVEDWIAEGLLKRYLSRDLLSRIKIVPIGSHSAVVHQMAARFLDSRKQATVALLDGDQRAALGAHMKRFSGLIDSKSKDSSWAKDRCSFLPGDDSPERWVLSRARELSEPVLRDHFRVENGAEIFEALDQALLIGDHRELYTFSTVLGMIESDSWRDLCQIVAAKFPDALNEVRDLIKKQLAE